MLTYTAPRVLLGLGLLVAIPGIALALFQGPMETFSLVHLMAPVLFGFACFKGALAVDALLQRRRDPAAAQRLLAHHGSSRALSSWIAYKFAAMTMALFAAGVCLLQIF